MDVIIKDKSDIQCFQHKIFKKICFLAEKHFANPFFSKKKEDRFFYKTRLVTGFDFVSIFQ